MTWSYFCCDEENASNVNMVKITTMKCSRLQASRVYCLHASAMGTFHRALLLRYCSAEDNAQSSTVTKMFSHTTSDRDTESDQFEL